MVSINGVSFRDIDPRPGGNLGSLVSPGNPIGAVDFQSAILNATQPVAVSPAPTLQSIFNSPYSGIPQFQQPQLFPLPYPQPGFPQQPVFNPNRPVLQLLVSVLGLLQQVLQLLQGGLGGVPQQNQTISGNTGPFNTSLPGGFGANAAANFQSLEQSNPLAAQQATINYTPTGQPTRFDGIAYGIETLRKNDTNQDGQLNALELSRALNINPLRSAAYLQALDKDGNRQINLQEFIPVAFAMDEPQGILSNGAPADGQITPQNRRDFQRLVETNPTLAKIVLEQLQQTLQLPQKLQELMTGNTQLFPR